MQEEKRRGFIFNYSWVNMLKDESDEVRLEAFDAIMAYATKKEKIRPSKDFRMAYKLIIKDIDYNELSYQELHQKRSKASKERWERERQKTSDSEQCNAMQTMQCNANYAKQCNAMQTMQSNANYADRMIDRNDRNDRNDRRERIEEKEKEKEDVTTSSRTHKKEKVPYVNPLDVEVINSDTFKKFRNWQKENTPKIMSMKYDNFITEDQFYDLLDLIDPTKEDDDNAILTIKNVLIKMENRNDKHRNYQNLYRATLNWLKTENAFKVSDEEVKKAYLG